VAFGHKAIYALYNLSQQLRRRQHEASMEVQAVRQHLLGHMHPAQVAQVAQIKHAPAADAESGGLQPHDKHLPGGFLLITS
jgi:hypothetical protein